MPDYFQDWLADDFQVIEPEQASGFGILISDPPLGIGNKKWNLRLVLSRTGRHLAC